MAKSSFLLGLLNFVPEVRAPKVKYLSLKEKMKWTLLILVAFFVMGAIPLYGLSSNSLQRFEYLSLIMGASFGSLITLGIGPIVTASIILQLLNGSGILKFDLTSHEGKRKFQGYQKLLAIAFIFIEAAIYVYSGGLAPDAAILDANPAKFQMLQFGLFVQIVIGGFLIFLMDDLLNKWGIGSGISLFIAAGVSQTIFLGLFSPFSIEGQAGSGALFEIFRALSSGDTTGLFTSISSIVFTFVIFALAVYLQSMKVELSLSFSQARGKGFKWPLNFIYTSNIPVILVAALLGNLQLLGKLLGGSETMFAWVNPFNLVEKIASGTFMMPTDLFHTLVYLGVMVFGAIVFSLFWVQTSGMDSESQANQIVKSGLQLPGFRKDKRVLKMVLDSYIPALTVLGAASVGFLAAFADLTGALGRGTGILLTVMIIYNFYEKLTRDHMMEMNPMLKKFVKK